jgi:hypothetical protein
MKRKTMTILKSTLSGGVFLGLASLLPAQTFSSGSTGADGAYSPTVTGDFDPVALGIDAAGDNVFNFTTINIPAGVTIRVRASKVRNASVVWLATGNVTIAGTIDISGDAGYTLDASSTTASTRRPAEPGAGGYYGGLGSRDGVGPEAGSGPGAGPAGANSSMTYQCWGGSGASFTAGIAPANYPYTSGTGQPYGNAYPVPLYGGSGGGGGWGSGAVNALGGGGGAGGGAIRIVSTTQVSLTGTINAAGGDAGYVNNPNGSCPGGPGAGGVVNLIAPTITGDGSIYVSSGRGSGGGGSIASYLNNGLVRFGVTNYNFTGSVGGGYFNNGVSSGTLLVSSLYNAPANSGLALPLITILKVNGVAVAQPPSGNYLSPDVTINANTSVTVNASAVNIPVGTIPVLRLTSETAGDQLINCAALAGTLAASTTTCSATFPFAISIAELRASF